MTLLLAYIVVGALVAIAIWAVVEHHVAEQRIQNQRAAWVHRERLAELAFKVQDNPDIPCIVRKAVNVLADRAFDDQFMKTILRMKPPKEAPSLLEDIRRDSGDANAALVIEALSAMAFIILLSNRPAGVQLRADSTDVKKMHEDRSEKIRPIRSSLTEVIIAEPEIAAAA